MKKDYQEKKIIQDIKKKAPSILLVGLGAPKQEKWIYDNIRLVGAKVAIGVGGSFDIKLKGDSFSAVVTLPLER